jgi:hypothetical protein
VLDALVDLRCDCAQGFLWSPALPAAEVRRVLGVDGTDAVAEKHLEITTDDDTTARPGTLVIR